MILRFFTMLALLGSQAHAQPLPLLGTFPSSLVRQQDVVEYCYDGRPHRSVQYYRALAQAVQLEFGMDTVLVSPIRLVFVPDSIMQQIVKRNKNQFRDTAALYGCFFRPCLIVMEGDDESDNTFMHEWMHELHYLNKIFIMVDDIDEEHGLIRMNEGLMLGSKSYIEFLERGLR